MNEQLGLFGETALALRPEVVVPALVAKGLDSTDPLGEGLPESGTTEDGLVYQVMAGEVRISAASLCRVLGLGNPSDFIKRIPADMRGLCPFRDGRGVMQPTNYVNWDGFARACQDSRKPNAIPIRDKQARLWGSWVRNKIGQPQPVVTSIENGQTPGLLREILDEVRDLGRRVATIEGVVPTIGLVKEDTTIIRENQPRPRNPVGVETMELHRRLVAHYYHDYCPCCEDVRILDSDGKWIKGASELDHWHNRRDRNGADETWKVCKGCHDEMSRSESAREENLSQFSVYRRRVERAQKPLEVAAR